MFTILIVDDSAVDRQWAGGLLEERSDVKVIYAEDGQAALKLVEDSRPDLVLTDLQMPKMNGLQLVEQIRTHHAEVPVILMTAYGSEDIALQALEIGAASYIPKRKLAEEVGEAVDDIMALSRARRGEQSALDMLKETEMEFELTNDLGAIPDVIGYLEKGLQRMKLCDGSGMIRVAVALREALVNAICHGNLELSSQLKEEGDGRAYHDLMETRIRQDPYASRRVRLTLLESRAQAVYNIRDEGSGFDPSILPDPTDPANMEKASGRGLLLIRTFMDEVYHDNNGREITMILRKDDRQ